jgi:hypothetical protein
MEGELVRSLLDAEGIPCVVQGDNPYSTGAANDLVKPRVLVVRRDLERALALLESSRMAEAAGLGEAPCPVHGEVSTAVCVECGTFLCARCAFRRSRPQCEDCQQGKSAILEKPKYKPIVVIGYVMASVCLGLILWAMYLQGVN